MGIHPHLANVDLAVYGDLAVGRVVILNNPPAPCYGGGCGTVLRTTQVIPTRYLEDEEGKRKRDDWYDEVPKAIIFRALAQKNQLKILESKDATSICRRDMASRVKNPESDFWGRGPKIYSFRHFVI